MITEQQIHYNKARFQDFRRVAARESQQYAEQVSTPSVADKLLAYTGDFLITVGYGLQRRYRRVEEGMTLGNYDRGQGIGRAL